MNRNYPMLVKISAFYNLLIGGSIVLIPDLLFKISDYTVPNYLILWQCLGMTVAVVGYGMYLASSNLNQNRNLLILGILGKLFGPVILGGYGVITRQLPLIFLPVIIFDLLWSILYSVIIKSLTK